MRRSLSVAALAAAVALAVSGSASAAVPGATTGEATEVTDTGAILHGVVDPHKEETTVYFEYGTSTAYGSQTGSQVFGGNAGKDVSAILTGLAPSTTYHFRLVATNASGSSQGQDKTFTTLAPGAAPTPSAVTLAANPTRVRFGRTTTLSGQASGNKAAGAEVVVEQNPFPYTGPFAPVGSPVVTDAAGAYSATVVPAVNTRYQVTAKTSPPVTSAPVQVNVAPAVSLRVGDTRVRRGRRVRFSGRVAPAHDGVYAQIQRRRGTGPFRTIARVLLRKSTDPARSVYRRRVRARRTATYRVRVPAHDDHVTGKSRKRRIQVR